ncbi:MAG: DinB family protein [Actinomycetota bacterium]|nr:DinB family protein [Actinomycetota bacterium]
MAGDPKTPTPPAVPPDDKDWTWVLERPCPECGFDASAVAVDDIPSLVRDNAAAWGAALAAPGASSRPRPDVWSPLEYGCHVRDVFRLYDERLHRMLDEGDPLFANWDQDETAVSERYFDQDPQTVSLEIAADADTVAASFEAVRPDQLARPGRRSDGAAFTVDTFARYFVHDPIHHLHDVRDG